ncbi:bifunctional phosphoserine phosphatase/homoserine phosphotransferase ThrH [Fibrobacter sp.]|uniref:bifunctional phosphoserine phosphatase/homoserine phosphotransferase ThrH n=1 Tax=Fibrobacter sp. TaxID=35828 RepID=UPI00388E2278
MFTKQCVVTLDLEGVLAPEIWIAVAEKTGVADLRLTTRDIPNYDELMKGRIKILDREGIKLSDIQNVIANLGLLDGARAFMDQLRDETQVIILSDTFQEFAYPIMKNLGFPTIFCHNLEVQNDRIVGYHLRLTDQKAKVVKHLQDLNFKVFASGDSFNDTGMLLQAEKGCFFCAPDSIVAQFPQLEATKTYAELLEKFHQFQATL